jgi:hypothetical protein
MSEAIFGIAGVIIGALLTWLKDWKTEKHLLDRHARYLVIRVICILDEFLKRCAEVVADDGLVDGQLNREGNLEFQVPLPDSPSFPEDVDWKSINHETMYKILAIPGRVEAENRAINFLWDEYGCIDYFKERQYRYACLGLDIGELARELRCEYGIPNQKLDNMDSMKFLEERKDAIDRKRKRRDSQPSILN